MKILAITNTHFLNYTKNDLDFYQQNLSEKITPPDSFEIVESVERNLNDNNSTSQKNKMLMKIAKIFEDAGAFQTALDFYKNVKRDIPFENIKKQKDIDFDIQRVTEKIYKSNETNKKQEDL